MVLSMSKTDVYQIVTDRIIDRLEKGADRLRSELGLREFPIAFGNNNRRQRRRPSRGHDAAADR